MAGESRRRRAKYAKCVGTGARRTSRYAANAAGGFDASSDRARQYSISDGSYLSNSAGGMAFSVTMAAAGLPRANASEPSTSAWSFGNCRRSAARSAAASASRFCFTRVRRRCVSAAEVAGKRPGTAMAAVINCSAAASLPCSCAAREA